MHESSTGKTNTEIITDSPGETNYLNAVEIALAILALTL
jgi:hypothetical protein